MSYYRVLRIGEIERLPEYGRQDEASYFATRIPSRYIAPRSGPLCPLPSWDIRCENHFGRKACSHHRNTLRMPRTFLIAHRPAASSLSAFALPSGVSAQSSIRHA